ncbi:hypothetical protein [Thalassomonas sp. M1454]|nr:hypothetical protein [Thalassomonas sp. M1454]
MTFVLLAVTYTNPIKNEQLINGLGITVFYSLIEKGPDGPFHLLI